MKHDVLSTCLFVVQPVVLRLCLYLCYSNKQQFEIPEEEAEWVGLTLEEAVEKQRLLEKKVMISVKLSCIVTALCLFNVFHPPVLHF